LDGRERAGESLTRAPTLAALASIPTRAEILEGTLRSLRPQVDRIAVYLNGYPEVPAIVHELADEHVLCPENGGAERKFWWADKHDGIYLSCDDDITYPPDYVERMCAELEEHGGIVSAHGRVYLGKPYDVERVEPGSVGVYHRRVDYGRPVNHCGTGVAAWDARTVHVPTEWPLRNMADMQLAMWAQGARVPMWLIAHQANWLKSPTIHDTQSLWHQSRIQGHRKRSEVLRAFGERVGWRMVC
jgi:hypothetical protein